MIVNATVIVAVYISTRFWKKKRHEQALALPASITAENETTILAPEDARENHQMRVELQEYRHQFKVSSATLVTTSLGHFIYPPIAILNLALLTYSATSMIDRAADSLLRKKKVHNDVYSATVALLCIGGGQYFAAAIHNTFYHLASRLVRESKQDTSEQIQSSFLQQSEEVWVICDGIELQKPLLDVQLDDIVVVNISEMIPVSGAVVFGHALVNQQAATGENQPIAVGEGDQVLAHTQLVAGRIHVRASCTGQQSLSTQLHQLLCNTRDYKTTLQLKGEAWANQAALPALGFCGVVGLFFGLPPATALLFSLPANSVRAILAVQTSTFLRQMNEQGILIRDGRVLEELPLVDIVLFDKTGTLTESNPTVLGVLSCTERTENELLQLAAAAEQHLHHPIATALLEEAASRGLQLPEQNDAQYELGFGVRATIDGKCIQVGNVRFMRECVGIDEIPTSLEQFIAADDGHTFVLVAMDQQLLGAIELYPQLRQEVPALIDRLRRRGFHNLRLVSGDTQGACEYMRQNLALDEAHGDMLPEDKVALIQRLQHDGHRVCFVGDGLNDAIAMKQANVSICLSSAADLTATTAQIVLASDDLMDIHTVMDMSMLLHVKLAGNLGFWVGFGLLNAVFVPFLHFAPLQSGLFFGGTFSYVFHHARKPTVLPNVDNQSMKKIN